MFIDVEQFQEDYPGLPLDVALGIPRGSIQFLLESFSDLQKAVINERFGLLDNKPKTLQECAASMGLEDAGRVLDLERKAMSKLYHLAAQVSLKYTSATWRPVEICSHENCSTQVEEFIEKAKEVQREYQAKMDEKLRVADASED